MKRTADTLRGTKWIDFRIISYKITLYKADILLRQTDIFTPMVSALDRFHCTKISMGEKWFSWSKRENITWIMTSPWGVISALQPGSTSIVLKTMFCIYIVSQDNKQEKNHGFIKKTSRRKHCQYCTVHNINLITVEKAKASSGKVKLSKHLVVFIVQRGLRLETYGKGWQAMILAGTNGSESGIEILGR